MLPHHIHHTLFLMSAHAVRDGITNEYYVNSRVYSKGRDCQVHTWFRCRSEQGRSRQAVPLQRQPIVKDPFVTPQIDIKLYIDVLW